MYELIGYRRVDMEAERKNDRDVNGFSCWFTVDENDPDFTGRSACKVFFSDDKFPDFKPKLNGRYLLVFNQKGKIVAFEELDG